MDTEFLNIGLVSFIYLCWAPLNPKFFNWNFSCSPKDKASFSFKFKWEENFTELLVVEDLGGDVFFV